MLDINYSVRIILIAFTSFKYEREKNIAEYFFDIMKAFDDPY